MNKYINVIYKNNNLIYKGLLFLITVISIVYLFPKTGQFKYNFTKGKHWQYNNLYAPFDFDIQKTESEINKEKKDIEKNLTNYFIYDVDKISEIKKAFENQIKLINKDDSLSEIQWNNLIKKGNEIINKVYKNGFIDPVSQQKIIDKTNIISLIKLNKVEGVPYQNLVTTKNVFKIITNNLGEKLYSFNQNSIQNILSDIIKPNVYFDANYTQKSLKKALSDISYTKGKVSKGELIILKGEIVEGKKYAILNSLKKESELKVGAQINYNWITFGYTILVSLALLMLFLFLRKYRVKIFNDNNKVTFIFFNIFLMILIQTMVIKYNSNYLYIVPLTVLPIILKTFFDARLGLFTHILTVLLLGFIVFDSFEFIYLHTIAGIVTILTVSQLYKRANLFISIAQITFIYILTYFSFSIIKEGNTSQIKGYYFILFIINGLLSFLSVFFIYLYEKIFGLVSDVTLLELSNTNSKLLRDLNEKAPGTFQHSMQVANLAEAAANEIDANSMLVRIGALYHDIGKMLNPMYFIENQSTSVNPHNDLSPKDSVDMILNHVIKGVELAKKHRLPDRIIDFIRTHHGTSLVYYFYKKQQEIYKGEQVDLKEFQYRGPIPFSKETAILMMCDATEAASKSLKNHTSESISNLVDKIIEKQKSDNQFINSNITFREIETIKKVIKKKLMNVYHLRLEYPE